MHSFPQKVFPETVLIFLAKLYFLNFNCHRPVLSKKLRVFSSGGHCSSTLCTPYNYYLDKPNALLHIVIRTPNNIKLYCLVKKKLIVCFKAYQLVPNYCKIRYCGNSTTWSWLNKWTKDYINFNKGSTSTSLYYGPANLKMLCIICKVPIVQLQWKS